ncbi:MAG: MSCRAMM family protein, partial [Bryobacteraceae bacterium]
MCARAVVRGSLLALSMVLLCAWQTKQVRTISGTVLDAATGEPIPHALVRVLSNAALSAMTGADGHFEIPKVPAGRTVSIAAKRPGYGNPQMPSQGRKSVGPGENDITIELVPQGGIQGRIVDENGQPLQGIRVQAIAQEIRNGRKERRSVSTASTDSAGEYELDGLAAGTYFIKTFLQRLYMTYAPLAAAQQAYASEFYPDAPDRAAAQPVQVQPGQTAEADFTLKTVRTFRIAGIVTGLGTSQPGFVTFEQQDGGQFNVPTRFNRRTGQFTALDIPAGAYKLVFRTYA